ncbi:hypothetical protein SPRA44_90209 [Serratia proteamaculans]|nr:hypothetical protein SPRA44_90209 [Serratia proteamaculans]
MIFLLLYQFSYIPNEMHGPIAKGILLLPTTNGVMLWVIITTACVSSKSMKAPA